MSKFDAQGNLHAGDGKFAEQHKTPPAGGLGDGATPGMAELEAQIAAGEPWVNLPHAYLVQANLEGKTLTYAILGVGQGSFVEGVVKKLVEQDLCFKAPGGASALVNAHEQRKTRPGVTSFRARGCHAPSHHLMDLSTYATRPGCAVSLLFQSEFDCRFCAL